MSPVQHEAARRAILSRMREGPFVLRDLLRAGRRAANTKEEVDHLALELRAEVGAVRLISGRYAAPARC